MKNNDPISMYSPNTTSSKRNGFMLNVSAWNLVRVFGVFLLFSHSIALADSDKPNLLLSGAGSNVPIMRLLTADQYIASIKDLFGDDVQVVASLPVVQRQQGLLALGSGRSVLTPNALSILANTARLVAAQVTDPNHRDILIPCRPKAADRVDKRCAKQFIEEVGAHLFRRPLTHEEVSSYVALSMGTAEASEDFYAGLASVLSGMLISPKFLYITESTLPNNKKKESEQPRSLDAYSRASRLSFFLWNSPPDQSLLKAAKAGDLFSKAGLSAQIDRMMNSAKYERGVRTFFSDMLGFDAFGALAKDQTIYPAFTAKVAADAKEQTLRRIVQHLVIEHGDYRELFNLATPQITADLGPIYRQPVSAYSNWSLLKSTGRGDDGGLLTDVSFLALHSHPGRSSPTLRGRAIREQLLCQTVPEPPPNVDFSAVEDPDSRLKTTRERLSAHSTNPSCAGCHKITDPIGLSLEKYDGAGQYREQENGALIDVAGEFEGKTFLGAQGLAAAIRESRALRSCLVSRMYAFAKGTPITPADKEALGRFEKSFVRSGYRVPELMRIILESDAFFLVH